MRAALRFMARMARFFQSAWQPLTPRGVARFAGASSGRLWLAQCGFALLAAAGVTWFVHTAWFPTVQAAVAKLPAAGEIRAGQLYWEEASPQMLAEGPFLSIAVDLTHSGKLRGPAQVQVEFGRGSLEVCGLFGCVDLPYPLDGVFGLNSAEAGPWWGAWRPAILAGVFGVTMAGLMVAWQVLAAVYCTPVWLLGVFANRALTFRGAWRLCGAAQMPGALFMTATVFLHGLGWLDPVRVAVAFAAHLVVGWVYLALSPLMLPSAEPTARGNPFADGDRGEATKSGTAKSGGSNPFNRN
jgi:hypothetical protein